jgi:hypothetical protein
MTLGSSGWERWFSLVSRRRPFKSNVLSHSSSMLPQRGQGGLGGVIICLRRPMKGHLSCLPVAAPVERPAARFIFANALVNAG